MKKRPIVIEQTKLLCPDCRTELKEDTCENCGCKITNKTNKKYDSILKIIVDIVGILGFLLSIFNIYQTRVIDRREQITIFDVYESNYFFDGKHLIKDLSVVVSNNSYIDVSITEIDVEYNGDIYRFNSNNCDKLPINLESNNTDICDVSLEFNIDSTTLELLERDYNKLDYQNNLDLGLYFTEIISSESNVVLTTAKNTTSTYTWYIGYRGHGGKSSSHGVTGKF